MDKIIANAYYDLGGFTNIQEHLRDSKKKDKSITLDDIKKWRSQNIEQTKNNYG